MAGTVIPLTRGPMAKHASARQRGNKVSTAREIVLRGEHDGLLPVPPLPVRPEVEGKYARPAEWHPQTLITWAELWQFPLVYEAPPVDRLGINILINLLDQFNYRADENRPLTELAKEIRPYMEMWGIGEKARRHLQITIEDAKDAIERGRKRETVQFGAQEPSASAFTPNWSEDDEDDGSIMDAEVVQ
jgi:hypothetical protein